MDKIINKLIKTLKTEFWMLWAITIILLAAGETNIIPNGEFALKGTKAEFYVNIANIILVVVCVPLALKLFSLNTQKGLRRMNNDEALSSYHLWSRIRLAFLLLCIIVGLSTYYLIQDPSNTGLFCAATALLVSLLCYPSADKIHAYINQSEDNKVEEFPAAEKAE